LLGALTEHGDSGEADSMRQVLQRQRDGRLEVRDVPVPALVPGTALVRLECSLISAGTERSKVELAGKSLIGKARARPELARQVVRRARTDGVRPTVDRVRARLEQWEPMGYSAAGRVMEVADGFAGAAPGDRVACAGGGLANHAEYVLTTSLLCAQVPPGVSPEHACFATVGAIALQGVRQSGVTLGERVAVVGLGLVGQLTVQLLKAAGCTVVGVDLDPRLCERARRCGADEAVAREEVAIDETSNGCDAVIVTAAAASADPVVLAGELARDRATVVVVGDVKLDAPRELYYRKELQLRLSRSYGPGRYDAAYEQRGLDYPAGYVRWTEQRNMAAVLDLIARGRVDPALIGIERYPIDEAAEAYERLRAESGEAARPLAIVLDYPAPPKDGPGPAPRPGARHVSRWSLAPTGTAADIGVGVIGAGGFAQGVLLPQLRGHVRLRAIASASGVSAATAAERFAFEHTAASGDQVIADARVDLVVILTRHDSHAELVCRSLAAGKATYVEKPLALSWDELQRVRDAIDGSEAPLFVGYNRRAAPLTEAARAALAPGHPRTILYRVNAGPRGQDHWLDDPEVGGGALLGEACHFVDLVVHLADSPPSVVLAQAAATSGPLAAAREFVVGVRLENGSLGTVVYSTLGDAALAKERIEIFGGGRAVVVDNFRSGELISFGRRRALRARAGKGFSEHVAQLLGVLRGERAAPDPRGYVLSSAATLAALTSMQTGVKVGVDAEGPEPASLRPHEPPLA
jgi:predicted dehydrogenase